jgi:hypothetical protein
VVLFIELLFHVFAGDIGHGDPDDKSIVSHRSGNLSAIFMVGILGAFTGEVIGKLIP